MFMRESRQYIEKKIVLGTGKEESMSRCTDRRDIENGVKHDTIRYKQ